MAAVLLSAGCAASIEDAEPAADPVAVGPRCDNANTTRLCQSTQGGDVANPANRHRA